MERDLIPLRHTAAHILAQAVKRLFPEARLAIGPPIETGFYYDFAVSRPFTEEDLRRIEAEMQKIAQTDYPVTRTVTSKSEAREKLKDEPFKIEILDELDEAEVSFYTQGEFTDLCRGPHVASTGMVKYFKILSTSGAYWRGDEKRPMLQRIYGTAFYTKEELDAYLKYLEEVERRDHRRIGREQELFAILPEEAGPGLVFYLPDGATLRSILEEISIKEHLGRGYQRVITPHLMKADIWKTSGHWENYREHMFVISGAGEEDDEETYGVKPMNCPAHILIYKMKRRSYRELPMRIFEPGTVYRYERGGTMHGLMRVRGLTIDDAHIFTPLALLESEIQGVMQFLNELMGIFGLTFGLQVSGKPDKAMGSDEIWQKATSALENALYNLNLSYEFRPGEGAFYGPKIDVLLKDAIGRHWQGPTIQVDFNLPERFGLTFVNSEDKEERPVIVHRALYGSFERFIGLLIEHYAGKFPTWLSPLQVIVLPISERHHAYATEVTRYLRGRGLRAEADLRNETLNYRVRDGQKRRVPYLLVVGDREVADQTVSVRHRDRGNEGAMTAEEFLTRIAPELDYKGAG
ncbi:MAG: threonine--tRNA ligase [bacterium JZ-2024 1]